METLSKVITLDVTEWSEDEIKVLQTLYERINKGRKSYGKLCIQTDVKDWINEALEEAIDLAVYLTIKKIQ